MLVAPQLVLVPEVLSLGLGRVGLYGHIFEAHIMCWIFTDIMFQP